MKTRIMHTKFWKDGFVSELSPVEKLLFAYLLTNENVNIIHMYECSDRQIMFDTGLNSEQLERGKEKLQNAGKVFFFKGWVYLKNADKYERYEGIKNEQAKVNLYEEIDTEIKAHFSQVRDTPINTPLIGTINHKSETINQKSKGGVGGFELTTETLAELQTKYAFDIYAEYERAQDWVKANGKRYRDYAAFFRNWLRRVAERPAATKKGGTLDLSTY